ncbi:MAG TPA: helix-turn-helix domain-containing protein [Candidatus Absconditabacterales bacterium]|nr:helix-turn-helix domain-containing protein [Candidatus Absconditabacterales bacterium]
MKLGFSQGEAKVYIALLNGGDLTATELANKTSLGRTNIYNYAKSLQERALIADYERNNKVFFKASDPRELYALLDIQKKELNNLSLEHLNLLPRFNKIYRQQSKSPIAHLYLGKKDWKKLMKELYLDQESKEIYVLVPDLDDYSPLPPVYQSALFNNKTLTHLITNNAASIEKFVKKDSKKNRKTFFIDKSILPINVETVIAKNSVYYGNFTQNDLQVNSIEDKYISRIFLTLLGFLTKSQYQGNL